MTHLTHDDEYVDFDAFNSVDVVRDRERIDPQTALDNVVEWARLDRPTYGWRRALHRYLGINLGPSRHERTIRRMVQTVLTELENQKEHST